MRNPQGGSRPSAKSFLEISGENPYAQLGVSPLAPTGEISTRINTLLAQARRKVLAKAAKSLDDPDEKELLRLQKIDQEIGEAKRRRTYDERNPQNILLTVQPSASEQAWLRFRRAGLISEWVHQTLSGDCGGGYGEMAFLPTANCARLWAPSGLDEAVLTFLAEFEQAESATQSPVEAIAGTETTAADAVGRQLTVSDLETMIGKEQE
jgi:hypothetical protein